MLNIKCCLTEWTVSQTRNFTYFLVGIYIVGSLCLSPHIDQVVPLLNVSPGLPLAASQTVYEVEITQEGHSSPCVLQVCPFISPEIDYVRTFNLIQRTGRAMRRGEDHYKVYLGQLDGILKAHVRGEFSYALKSRLVNVKNYALQGEILNEKVLYDQGIEN